MDHDADRPTVHVLVDLENNQPTLADVRRLVPDLTSAWLFHSPPLASHVASYAVLGEQHTPVPLSRPGKNSLDFHLAFYVGYIAAKYPHARQVVLAIDRGYEPMVEHANTLGVDVRIVPFKSGAVIKRVAAKKVAAKTTAAKKAGAKTKSPKKSVASKRPAPQKTAGNSVPAKQVHKKSPSAAQAPAMKSAAAKASPAKPAPAKKKALPTHKPASNPTVKVPPKAPGTVKPAASPMQPLTLNPRTLMARLRKMGNKRPPKREALLRYLAAQMRCKADDPLVIGMWGTLLAAGAVRLDGDAVVYGPVVTGRSD